MVRRSLYTMFVVTSTIALAAVTSRISAASAPAQSSTARQASEEAFSLPTTPTWLGTVTLPRPVLADGQRLERGTYRVRLTGEVAKEVVGQRPASERWVEFVQKDEVRGRSMAPVVAAAAVEEVTPKASVPAAGRSRVQSLRAGDDYLRVWFNHQGDQVLIYLPYAP